MLLGSPPSEFACPLLAGCVTCVDPPYRSLSICALSLSASAPLNQSVSLGCWAACVPPLSFDVLLLVFPLLWLSGLFAWLPITELVADAGPEFYALVFCIGAMLGVFLACCILTLAIVPAPSLLRWKMFNKTGIKHVYQNWDRACVPGGPGGVPLASCDWHWRHSQACEVRAVGAGLKLVYIDWDDFFRIFDGWVRLTNDD